jgi:hypothetical protein
LLLSLSFPTFPTMSSAAWAANKHSADECNAEFRTLRVGE